MWWAVEQKNNKFYYVVAQNRMNELQEHKKNPVPEPKKRENHNQRSVIKLLNKLRSRGEQQNNKQI